MCLLCLLYLLYLLFVTLLPFSTVVMGRFTAYAAATALYAANIGLVAATGFLLMSVLLHQALPWPATRCSRYHEGRAQARASRSAAPPS